MIKYVINRVLRRHLTWRTVSFDELTELYVSSMLRTFAISLLSVFVPFFLYRQGYSVPAIFLVFAAFFGARAVADVAAAYRVAKVGPKHTIIISCLLQLVSAAMFLSVPEVHWHWLLLGSVWGASASFFFIAYHTEFSKIKHALHAGKEIGSMQIMEKAGGVAGPIIGGLAGSFLGGRYIFLFASLVLGASLWPLFRTQEPVKTGQQLHFRELSPGRVKRDLIAYAGLGIENTFCVNLWPFYVAVFVLQGAVYAQLGILTALAVVASMAGAYIIGHLIDQRRAHVTLRLAAVANALVYAVRPFVQSVGGVFATNLVNEAVTTGYRMPFLKGMYGAADDLPGLRIVYVTVMECFGDIAKATAWCLLAIIATVLPLHAVLLIGFAMAGAASLLITAEQFKALRTSRRL